MINVQRAKQQGFTLIELINDCGGDYWYFGGCGFAGLSGL